jgi:hypothetical protein
LPEVGEIGKETGSFDFINPHFALHASHFAQTLISVTQENIISGASLLNFLPGGAQMGGKAMVFYSRVFVPVLPDSPPKCRKRSTAYCLDVRR